MNIEVIQKTDEAYYLEWYSECIEYRNKFVKHQKLIGCFLILLALIIFFTVEDIFFISIIPLICGIALFYGSFSIKKKFLKQLRSNESYNSDVKFIFDNDKMTTIDKFSSSTVNWAGFKEAIKSPKGLVLVLENGANIYISKSALEEKYMDEIIAKIENTSR